MSLKKKKKKVLCLQMWTMDLISCQPAKGRRRLTKMLTARENDVDTFPEPDSRVRQSATDKLRKCCFYVLFVMGALYEKEALDLCAGCQDVERVFGLNDKLKPYKCEITLASPDDDGL